MLIKFFKRVLYIVRCEYYRRLKKIYGHFSLHKKVDDVNEILVEFKRSFEF